MKINWKKIFVGFFVFSAVMFMCNLIFRYFQYVDIYSKEYQRASIYVQTDVCTNMLNRAKVGDFGRCDDAEQELETSPEWKATRQIMDDLWLFGGGRWERLICSLESNIYYISIGVFLVLLVGLKMFNDRRLAENVSYHSMPLTMTRRSFNGPIFSTINEHSHVD